VNKRIRIVLSIILCLAFVGALGSAPAAKASPVVPPQPQESRSKAGDTVTIRATDSAIASAVNYTREQRQAAIPMALTDLKASDFNSISNASDGAPGFTPGGMGDPAALEKAIAENPDVLAANDRSALPAPSLTPFGTKNTWTGYLGNYFSPFYTTYPYRTVGQLFFTDGASTYSCTATLISHDTIVTAAHCVYNTDYNFWYGGWTFYPGYANGTALGVSNWYSAIVLTKWQDAKKSSKGLTYDVALIQLYDDPGYTFGWLGWTYNMSSKNVHHAIGYPGNLTGGNYTYICVAESFTKSSNLGMGCDMTFGSSGGPWILWLLPYQDSYPYSAYGNYVNAVVSGGVVGTPTFYGPRFTTKNIIPLCWGTGWC
jgi:hypothetical protein